MKTGRVIAIAGATGVVGNEMLRILEERKVPCAEVILLASEESAGELYSYLGEELEVRVLSENSFQGIDYVLFALSGELAAKYVPIAEKAGATVIDNSSNFRMNKNVPLIVPEVNRHVLKPEHTLIANPNCTTAQLVPVLEVIRKEAGLKRVVVSTYQAVSGAGKIALEELFDQTRAVYTQQAITPEAFQHQIAFNCIPQIDTILDNGFSREEMKVIEESRKILGIPDLKITATAVRVPVFHSHAESVAVETETELSPDRLIDLLSRAEGIEVYTQSDEYPMQIDAATQDPIFVGRIRKDESVEHGVLLWIVADNLRKGAALNAVQILEEMIKIRDVVQVSCSNN